MSPQQEADAQQEDPQTFSIYIDTKSVYAAVTAVSTNTPTKQSLCTHVLYMRELLDIGVVRCLVRLDARDTVAIGLTKGAVKRSALHMLMDG